MFEKEDIVPLSEEVFRLIRDLINQYSGLYFDDSYRYLIEKRLSRRVKGRQFDNFRDYYRYILYDKNSAEELSEVIDILTINETYFFREQNQIRAFSEEILPELKETNKYKRSLRIWSGGCSTGEEPYTIAMLINETGNFINWDIEIHGSDINQRVLQAARKGIYRKNSFRTTEPYIIQKYFRLEESSHRIIDSVRKNVTFNHLNLLDSVRTRFLGKMDVIFCRNVLIYFDYKSRKKVIENFHDRLVDGGYLLLGHAESLLNISTAFSLKHFKNDLVYRKPIKKKDGI